MSLAMQAKVLRVIQNREIQRVGSPEVRQVNVRLIAATNRDLRAEVLAGRFREDLFYRLSSIQIRIPSVRRQFCSFLRKVLCRCRPVSVLDIRKRPVCPLFPFFPGEKMRTPKRLQLMLIVALIFTATVGAKCPTGTVTVHGRVQNLASAATAAEAIVVVETPKGKVSRTALVSNGEFTVEVPFSTVSSHFPPGSDRCNTVPKFVEIKIASGVKVYVQKRLDFKDNFEMTSPYQYRLRQKLSLDVPKEGADGTK